MTGTLLTEPVIRAVNAVGVPISGAQLQFYTTTTTTPTPVYTSSTLGTPLSNPVVSDSGGLFVPIYLDPAVVYRVQLKDGGGVLIRDIDPLNAIFTPGANTLTNAMLQAGVAVANIGYTPVNKAGDTATNLALAFTTPAATSAGYLGAPVNNQNVNYTFALGDAGGMVRANSAGAIAWTIPPNASVAYPVGTCIVVRNVGAGVVTLTRGAAVTQLLAGSGTSKDVALAQWGLATLIQEGVNNWTINGAGVS